MARASGFAVEFERSKKTSAGECNWTLRIKWPVVLLCGVIVVLVLMGAGVISGGDLGTVAREAVKAWLTD